MSRACVESARPAHYHSDPNRGQLLISRTKNGIVRFRSGIVRNLLLTSSRKFGGQFSSAIISLIIGVLFSIFLLSPLFPFLFSNGRTRTRDRDPWDPEKRRSYGAQGKNNGKQWKTANKGIPEDEWLQRATRWTDGHWTSLLWDLHHRFTYGLLGSSQPDDVLRWLSAS